MAQVDRGVRRGRRAIASVISVSRRSARRSGGGRVDAAAVFIALAGMSSSGVGLVLVGAEAVGAVGTRCVLAWARLPRSRKGTRWDQVLFVLVAYRLLSPGSEWRLHRQWFEGSALGGSARSGSRAWLTSTSSMSVTTSCSPTSVRCSIIWCERWRDLFNVDFDVLLYDLTSTYFESDPPFRRGGQTPVRLFPRQAPRLRTSGHRAGGDPRRLAAGLRSVARQHRRQNHVAGLSRSNRRTVWQGPKSLGDGPRHPHRGDAGADASGSDPPVHYLVGTPKGRLWPAWKRIFCSSPGSRLGRGCR